MTESALVPLTAHRWALYFAPAADSPWARAGACWLGRDADGISIVPLQPPSGWGIAQWSHVLSAPRRYGWHATLRAPWRLAAEYTWSDLSHAVLDLAGEFTAFELPVLRVQPLAGFLALCLTQRCEPLERLAGRCVAALQPFAAPLTSAEIERYRNQGLSERQHVQLCRWGYPYVWDDYRFHMTLTDRLDSLSPEQRAGLLSHAQACFDGLPQPVCFDALSLFVEPEAGAALRRVLRVPLGVRSK